MIKTYKRQRFDKPPWSIWFSHRNKDGTLVLKGQTSWKTIDGIGFNAFKHQIWITRKWMFN